MVIGFETVAYEVSEGQNQEFCVAILNGELELPVEVTLTTKDGTAVGEAVAIHNSDVHNDTTCHTEGLYRDGYCDVNRDPEPFCMACTSVNYSLLCLNRQIKAPIIV